IRAGRFGTHVRHSAKQVRSCQVEVVSEVNAARAFEMVAREKFDLVISDFRMREVDGLQLLARAHEHNPGGKRLLLTGHSGAIHGSPDLEAAALDGCLEKPMGPSMLTELLDAVLAGDRSTLDALRRGLEMKVRSRT
ncbi:MAG TPA: response regulator, partial [Candidatus Thermoplasmatota archaeon]|nr:response regulator [Candidatus Thermoplasmatota archaeon]